MNSAQPAAVCYLVHTELFSGGVVESQVVRALEERTRLKGHPAPRLYFAEPFRVAISRRAQTTLRSYRDTSPALPMAIVPFVSRWGRAAAGAGLALRVSLSGLPRHLVFHCRGAHATRMAAEATRWLGHRRIVFDIRGHGPFEAIHRLGYPTAEGLSPAARATFAAALDIDRRAAQRADHVLAISQGLKRYVETDLGVPPSRVSVVPSCVEKLSYDPETRAEVRKRWGVGEKDVVLVYSGRLGPPRLPTEMARVFALIAARRPKAKLVIFSDRREPGMLEHFRAAAPTPDALIVEALPQDQVLRQLCGADLALLFLESAARFHGLATPIKVAEYLSAGLPLAVNREVGAVPGLVEDRQIGWVIETDPGRDVMEHQIGLLLAELEADTAGRRRRVLETCSELFLWRRYADVLRNAYGLDSWPAGF